MYPGGGVTAWREDGVLPAVIGEEATSGEIDREVDRSLTSRERAGEELQDRCM